ncbi:unnamed protein product [marine sediment metagenome]|uniref:Uncharacterized protein n=1 Tax=marine sediment metagenome TaxID=412755 RepID=X1HFU7_9ZZZZ
MENRFNPLDPLGILGAVKHDVDRIGSSVISLPLPGPPGMARRTEEERAARHGGPPPERGTGFARLLDPLGLFSGGSNPQKGIGNPIPAEFNGKLVDMKGKARERLIAVGYSASIVDKALNWYEEWVMGMARRLAPGDTALQRQVVQAAYAEVEPKAERWIRGIQDAFGVPATV